MLVRTRGIVFHAIKYSESSVIAKIFTEDFGLQSVMVHSVRRQKAKTKTAVFQSLTLVDVVLYKKEMRDIQKVSEIKISPPFQTIYSDIRKSSSVIFLADVLRKAVKEEESNKNLFEFIYQSLLALDLKEEAIANFHLLFLIQLSRHLGFFPSGEYSENNPVFNLPEGYFQQSIPLHGLYLEKEEASLFFRLMNSDYQKLSEIHIPAISRKIILEKILEYYRLHISSFQEVNSHAILEEAMS